jgi:hypothetical protein
MTSTTSISTRALLAPPHDFWWIVQPLDADDHGPSITRWPTALLADRFLNEAILPDARDLHAAAVYDRLGHQIIICLCERHVVQQHRDAGMDHFGPMAIPVDSPLADASLHRGLNLLCHAYEPLSRSRRRASISRWAWIVAIVLAAAVLAQLYAKQTIAAARSSDALSQIHSALAISRAASIESLSPRQRAWHLAKAIDADCAAASLDAALLLLSSLAPSEPQHAGTLLGWTIRPGRITLTLAIEDEAAGRSMLDRFASLPDWRMEQHSRITQDAIGNRNRQTMLITLRAAGDQPSTRLAHRSVP